jgi:hypothetical protein
LQKESPKLSGRVTPEGVGFRENLIDLDIDDLRDAPD